MVQDNSAFVEYIRNSKNDHATSFYNITGDTLLAIPMPEEGKHFTAMKHFIDDAPKNRKEHFWEYVSQKISHLIEFNDEENTYWVSTHGRRVPYFHLRIPTKPKYYQTRSFIFGSITDHDGHNDYDDDDHDHDDHDDHNDYDDEENYERCEMEDLYMSTTSPNW